MKNLCRGGYASRQRVLRWFAEVLSSNELRAKMGHVLRMTQQQAAESLDPMHAMLLSEFVVPIHSTFLHGTGGDTYRTMKAVEDTRKYNKPVGESTLALGRS